MGLNEELIQLGIRKLKKETDLKRIAKLRKNLNKSGLSDEEIDRRLNALSLDEQSPTQESENPTQLSPQNIGYKKPHILVGDQMYVLA